MSRKFKVGDRVRCVDADGSSLKHGRELIVTDVWADLDVCYINGGWFESRFELVPEAPKKNHIVLSRKLYDSYTKMTLEDAKALAKDGTGPKDDFVVLAFTTGYQGREIRSVEVTEVNQ